MPIHATRSALHSPERTHTTPNCDEWRFTLPKDSVELIMQAIRDEKRGISDLGFEIINKHTLGITGNAPTYHAKQLAQEAAIRKIKEITHLPYTEGSVQIVNHLRVK